MELDDAEPKFPSPRYTIAIIREGYKKELEQGMTSGALSPITGCQLCGTYNSLNRIFFFIHPMPFRISTVYMNGVITYTNKVTFRQLSQTRLMSKNFYCYHLLKLATPPRPFNLPMKQLIKSN